MKPYTSPNGSLRDIKIDLPHRHTGPPGLPASGGSTCHVAIYGIKTKQKNIFLRASNPNSIQIYGYGELNASKAATAAIVLNGCDAVEITNLSDHWWKCCNHDRYVSILADKAPDADKPIAFDKYTRPILYLRQSPLDR